MNDAVQVVLVTLVAIAALAAIVLPYFRKPAPGLPACGNCPSAKRAVKRPAASASAQPLRFVDPRQGRTGVRPVR
jgi:hypothetical protein